MTADRTEEALAAQAQAAGERERASRDDHAEAMLRISGSAEDVTDASRSPDDGAVTWTGTSSEPPAVSPQPNRSPNVDDPIDNSQSQP